MTPSFEQLSYATYDALVRYARWLGVPVERTTDTKNGRHRLCMRIRKAINRGDTCY